MRRLHPPSLAWELQWNETFPLVLNFTVYFASATPGQQMQAQLDLKGYHPQPQQTAVQIFYKILQGFQSNPDKTSVRQQFSGVERRLLILKKQTKATSMQLTIILICCCLRLHVNLELHLHPYHLGSGRQYPAAIQRYIQFSKFLNNICMVIT